MQWWTYPVLLVAGVAAGITGSVAGLASLVSYPVLLAVGLAPVAANVSNTVALVFNGIGSVSSSRVELTGQGRRLWPLAIAAVVGGIAGGGLLLLAPAATFAYAVPWLIALASVAILVPTRPRQRTNGRNHQIALITGTGLIGVYAGYFGAAAGVLLLALLLAMMNDTFARSNAAKNLLTGVANGVAALAFIFFGPVEWLAVLPLAVGFFIGGLLGPAIVRQSPPAALRRIIALAGIGLAIYLGWQAYA